MNSLSNKGLGRFAKAITTLTSVATVLSMTGIAYLAPVAALAVAPSDYGLKEGDVVSAAGSSDPDVYIVNEMGYKRLFLNPAIFNFYGHLGGFSKVKTISATTRDAFGTSGLFRNCETNDQKVYGVETTGEDVGMLHWVNTSGAQAVMDDANFFKKVFCINTNEFNWYPKGSDYSSVNQVPNYSRGGSQQAGPISVSLASSNPASSTIVNGQSRYVLANFMFSGSGNVNSVKLKRMGVSADASLTNVYLYDGNRRITDSATVSNSEVFFNDASGLFSAGKVISVVADVSGTAGESMGMQVIAVNGTNITPVSGNLHSIATATLATTAMSTTTTPSSDGAPVPAADFLAWQNSVTIGQRYVWLKSVQYKVVGSVSTGDIQNFRLYLDGVQVGSAVSQQDANGYVVFDMSANPVKVETGGRTLKVLVDIIGGSGKNFYLSLRQKSDIWAVDSQYGAAVLATGTFPVSSTAQNIASGTLTITKKTDSPSGDVVKGASGVALARYEFKASGEKMKVENLRLSFTNASALDGDQLRNGAIFADGVQIGSTKDIFEETASGSVNTLGYQEYSLGSSLIVVPGTPRIVEIRSDIYDNSAGNDDTLAGQTIVANIVAGSSNVQRLTTLDYPTTPYTAQAGNTLTVRTGSFTAGKYTGYANQSVVSPKTGVKLGHYTLTAASSEDVMVNTITLDGQAAYGGAGTLTSDFTDAYVKVWNDAGSVVYTSPVKTTFSVTASNSYSVNFTIPKNKVYQVELWANAASSFAGGVDIIRTNMDAAGTTVGSSTTATATAVTGQTVTAASGALTVANASLPTSKFVGGGTTVNSYNFTLTPTYDDFTLDELYVDIASPTVASNSGAIATVMLKDGSNTLGTAVINSSTGSASFTGLNLSLMQSAGTKTLSVDVQFANVGVGANDTAGSVTVRLDGMKYRTSAGAVTTTTGLSTTTYTGNALVDVKGFPTFANVALPTTVLGNGTQTLFKTAVTANSGLLAWNNIVFTVASNSTNVAFSSPTTNFKLFENGVDITPLAASGIASVSYVDATNRTTRVEFNFATERAISAGNSVTLELQGTVSGSLTAGNSISTQIVNTSGTTVTSKNSADSIATTYNNFNWTDQSAPSHATTTSDWFTDGLVKTLAQSQSITK